MFSERRAFNSSVGESLAFIPSLLSWKPAHWQLGMKIRTRFCSSTKQRKGWGNFRAGGATLHLFCSSSVMCHPEGAHGGHFCRAPGLPSGPWKAPHRVKGRARGLRLIPDFHGGRELKVGTLPCLRAPEPQRAKCKCHFVHSSSKCVPRAHIRITHITIPSDIRTRALNWDHVS